MFDCFPKTPQVLLFEGFLVFDNVYKNISTAVQGGTMARANYDLPNDKIERVIKLSGASSKKEAIVIALDTYLKLKKREEIISSYGKIPLKWTQKSLRRYRA